MGQLTTQKQHKTKRKKHTPQQKFSEALQRFSRLEKQNQLFRDKLDQLVSRVTPKIRDSELQRYQAMQSLTLRLISFFSKKTLPEYMRDELYDWINQTIYQLSNNPFSQDIDLEDIYEAFHRELEKLQGLEKEKMLKKLKRQGLTDEDIEQAEEMIKQMQQSETIDEFLEDNAQLFDDLNDLDDAITPGQEDLFGDDESLFDDNDDDDFADPYDEFDDLFREDERREKQHEEEFSKLLKATSINKLFRRIARAIHPDLEQDTAKKQEKNEKMAKLIQAREQKDISVLLQIYTETFGQAPDDFPSEDYPKLTRIINYKIDQLRQQKDDILDEKPFYSVFYECFHAANPKQEDHKIRKHINAVTGEAQKLLAIANEISSIKVLRVYLSHRMEAAYHASNYYEDEYY